MTIEQEIRDLIAEQTGPQFRADDARHVEVMAAIAELRARLDEADPDVPPPPPPPPPPVDPPTGTRFVTRADCGPRVPLTPWGTRSTTITEASGPRDADGILRIRGFQIVGPVKLAVADVELVDCELAMSPSAAAPNPGVLYSSSSAPRGSLLVDHCLIDQGDSGYSAAGVNVYQPVKTTVRNTLIVGVGDGIKANSDCLYEDNFIQVNGQGKKHTPGHIDGIQGGYYKVNWTARHNTIIGGVGRTRPEAGGNIGIWGALDGAPYNYGVVAEDNYVDGFNTGISLQGTDPARPNIVRRNEFGTDFRFYPSLRIRTWSEYPHTVVEPNNVFDRILDETTGFTAPV